MQKGVMMIFEMPKDSRQRYTKQCLFETFERMLEEKPVSDIKVSDLCKEAGVSRKTFYKYYADPFMLLSAMQDDLFIGFKQVVEGLPRNIFAIAPELIRFSGEHRVVMRAAFANRGEGNVIDLIINWLYLTYREEWELANPNLSSREVRFLFQFVVSGLTGMVELWLVEYPSMPAEKVCAQADALLRLSTPQ